MDINALFQTQNFCTNWISEGRDPVEAKNNDIDDWAYEKNFSFKSLRSAVALLHEEGFIFLTSPDNAEEFDQRMKAASQREEMKAKSDLLTSELCNHQAFRDVIEEGRKLVNKRVENDPVLARIKQGNIERKEAEKKKKEDAQKALDRSKEDDDKPSPQTGAGARMLVRRKNQKNPENKK